MKRSARWDVGIGAAKLVLLGTVLLFFGCGALNFDPRGRMVPPDRWVAAPEAGDLTGVFENDDLTITYRMDRTGGQLRISGELRFAGRIAGNFPIIRYFHLGALLLDGQGKILDITALASVTFYGTQYATIPDYPIAFNKLLMIDENTRAIAFHYTGSAYDPNGNDGGTMDFWDYPVHQAGG